MAASSARESETTLRALSNVTRPSSEGGEGGGMAALRRDRRLRVGTSLRRDPHRGTSRGTPVDVAYERGTPGDFSYERGPCRHVGCLIRGGIFL